MKKLSLFCLPLILLAFALAGCGKGSSLTGPTADPDPNGGPMTLKASFQPMPRPTNPFSALLTRAMFALRGASPMAVMADPFAAPAPEDSIYGWGTFLSPGGVDWTAKRFLGFRRADGTFDRTITVAVANEQRGYELRLYYKKAGVIYPMFGTLSLSAGSNPAVAVTAYNWSKFGGFYTFEVLPPGSINPIRDDTAKWFWSEIVADGLMHPDSTSKNVIVTGNDFMTRFSSDSWLNSHDMIFVPDGARASWRMPALGFRGGTYYFRVNYASGAMLLPGVNLRNADGSLTQCRNIDDLDPGAGFYGVFVVNLNDAGVWVNPRAGDERFTDVVIRSAARYVPPAQVKQWMDAKLSSARTAYGLSWNSALN